VFEIILFTDGCGVGLLGFIDAYLILIYLFGCFVEILKKFRNPAG